MSLCVDGYHDSPVLAECDGWRVEICKYAKFLSKRGFGQIRVDVADGVARTKHKAKGVGVRPKRASFCLKNAIATDKHSFHRITPSILTQWISSRRKRQLLGFQTLIKMQHRARSARQEEQRIVTPIEHVTTVTQQKYRRFKVFTPSSSSYSVQLQSDLTLHIWRCNYGRTIATNSALEHGLMTSYYKPFLGRSLSPRLRTGSRGRNVWRSLTSSALDKPGDALHLLFYHVLHFPFPKCLRQWLMRHVTRSNGLPRGSVCQVSSRREDCASKGRSSWRLGRCRLGRWPDRFAFHFIPRCLCCIVGQELGALFLAELIS